jgi:hypothetical protein
MAPAASPRTKVGSWQCPSGNTCDAFVGRDRAGLMRITFEWETPPPLRPEDEVFYLGVIMPAIHRHLAERFEVPVARFLSAGLKDPS